MQPMQDLHVTIGLLMAVYKPGDRLAWSLERHAYYFDEVIVVHDGPAEQSLELVTKYPHCRTIATLYRQGYCEPVRQIALGMATTTWCLALDDDEELITEFLAKMREVVAQAEAEGLDGIGLNRLEINGITTLHARLFRRGRAYFTDVIHTNVSGLRNVRKHEGSEYQIVHRSETEIATAYRGRLPDRGDADALQEKKDRYAHVQRVLRLKYGRWHPELMAHLSVNYA
jgi:glycosyltransferase involved in cell wall biosynthesis